MNLVVHLVKKDLRRALPGMSAWVLLQFLFVAFIRLHDSSGQGALVTYWGTVLFPLAQLGNLMIGFLLSLGIMGEDSAQLGVGGWRSRPISDGQMFCAKLAALFVCVTLPPLLASLAALGWLHAGWKLGLSVLADQLLMQSFAALLGLAISVFTVERLLGLFAALFVVLCLVFSFAGGGASMFGRFVNFEQQGLATCWVLVATLLAAAALFSGWLHFHLRRRLYPMVVFGFSLCLSMLLLAKWDSNYAALFAPSASALRLVDGPFELRTHGAGRRTREARALELPATSTLEIRLCRGTMRLDGLEEPALEFLEFQAPGRSFEALLLGHEIGTVRYTCFENTSMWTGNSVRTDIRQLCGLTEKSFPDGKSAILARIPYIHPSREAQLYKAPAFDLHLEGVLWDARIDLEMPLNAGASAGTFSRSLRLTDLTSDKSGRLTLSLSALANSWSSVPHDVFIVHRGLGLYAGVQLPEQRDQLVPGLLQEFQAKVSADFSQALIKLGLTPDQWPTWLQAHRGEFVYVELGRTTPTRWQSELSIPEFHGIIPPYPEAEVVKYEEYQERIKKRRTPAGN